MNNHHAETETRRTTVKVPTLGGVFAFKARRVQLGFSQRELARSAEVSECTVRRLERGERITIAKLSRVAPFLELSFSQAMAIMFGLEEKDGEFVMEGTSSGHFLRKRGRS